ncbi:MAG: hypothetical protein K2M79_07365 [Muribaculaceae bacterium]|nr:hypothetical protein [Muribaculaceae bacterium]
MPKIPKILKAPFIYAFISIFILSGAAVYQCYIASRIEKTHKSLDRKWPEEYAAFREQINNLKPDSTWDKSIITYLDVVRTNQITIIDRQNDLIADLRQETNNNIDKLNLWLAFAAIIISTVGVFIPAWAQYIKDKNFKEDLNTFKEQTKDALVKDSETVISKCKEELKKYNKELKNFEHNASLQEMRSQFVSLSLGYETRLINNHSDREWLYGFLWARTVDSFNKVIELALKDETDRENSRIYITECLVLLCSFISKIKSSTVKLKPREWDRLQDEIRKLLKEISYGQNNRQFWLLYHEQLRKFIIKLNSVHLPQ